MEYKNGNNNRIDAIRRHPVFQEYDNRLEAAEHDRKLCRHGIEHLLDVARIAYIQNLEQGLDFSKEIIYAAALLHDIGKARQYEEGIPHEIASAEIAEVILEENGFDRKEREVILCAIREHRRYREEMSELGKLLYISDKKSRQCFACPAETECNWSLEKKNREIEI